VEHPVLGRLYRTGDAGRWRADGALEYLGRLDGQVKVRGCRVEPGEVEAALRQYPAVAAAAVLARQEAPGDTRLVAYVVPRGKGQDGDGREAGGERRAEQVARWQTVWEETYGRSAPHPNATFNTIGWDSSYTGLPIPEEEMREWLGHTVGRIQSLRPARVLEVGCGSGLLLFRIAPHCAGYTGLDFSEAALRYLCRQLAVPEPQLPQVNLLHRAAHELDGLQGEAFDTVVLNSVIQYFPNIDYLLRVLEGAAGVVRPGGRIFLGDVRNLRLLPAFHASVQLHKAPATLSRAQLLARVQSHAGRERELLVDPAFFAALPHHFPSISRVEVQLKRGRSHNELTRFRYDVVLHVGDGAATEAGADTRDWQDQALALPDVRRLLAEAAPARLSIRRVPNARLWSEMKTLELLEAAAGPETAGDLREALRAAGGVGVDPEELWALGQELGYDVAVRWSAAGGDGCYDVDFSHPASAAPQSANGTSHVQAATAAPRPWASYANDPLRGEAARDLVPQLRAHLKAKLPEPMVPSAFVVLDALPLSPNGKLDRNALPAPEGTRPELEEAYVAPRTPDEQALAEVWAEVLGLERVGAEDNFFDLGGHSLLATQVISRARKALKVEVPLRALFEAPTVAGLAERVEALRRAARGLPAAPLQSIPREGELPLSFGQETFWFLDQLEPGSPVFNIDVAVRLRGPLNLPAVERALTEVLRRHEALRTTFVATDGRPVAVIAPPAAMSLPVVDLTGLPEAEREAEARRLADEESRTPFDLARGPLFRVTLLRLGAEDHVGLVTAHHSVFDGWSFGVFLRDVGLLYQGFCAGQTAVLPELPVQYVDFAHWQRQWLKSGLMEDQLAYWKKQLGGNLPVLELPADHPRPAARTFHGACRMLIVPPALTAAVHALSRSEGCTLFMVLLAAFQALLHRYSGQEDLCVGTPIAGRNRTETEGLIGFFVNTLVLRTNLSGEPTFRQLLGRVREVALGAYAHQDLPFEMLVQALRPDRDPSHSSLFQVMFILQNAPLKIPSIAGLTAGPFLSLSDNGTSKFDLTLNIMEGSDGLATTVEYNTDLFEEGTIQRLLGHYQTLLEAVVADPDLNLPSLPLLTPAEHQQLAAWNRTEADHPEGKCIHHLFEAQVARSPDAVAVVCGERRLTYGELNGRANRLAHRLRDLGVGPEVLVGLYLDRSPELLIGVLGVLKAGGAYVPLDPAYPGERLGAVVEDAGFPVLLTQRALRKDLPAGGARLVCLDEDAPDGAPPSEENPGRVASAENLAYVIYTSGTTGRPKGVMLTHGGLCNAYRGWEGAYRLCAEATSHLQMASCAFDVFTGDWTRALCSGGKLVLCPREFLIDPPRLYELMRREEVDCAEFVPAVLRNLVQHLEETGESLAFMRLLVAGSDVWYAGEYRRIRRLCGPRTRLINSYGLTEATIDSTYFEGAELDLPEDRPVPIGRPFANTEVHILDRNLQPVPVGVPGELHLGGRGLARGYFRQPELTARKFTPDPFSGRPGARLFRTGDLARYLPDGTIELLGRTDDQVKIRGFRVEPGEIEAVLGRHPTVRQAIVVARGDRPERKHLVAYVTAHGAAPSAPDLRSFLREKLPDYMVPRAFVVLESLPLSPNGKVERQALPDGEAGAPVAGADFVAPRTPAEEMVADVWANVLGVERVGVEDNFFDLGGHSLLATQVISRLAQTCQVELPLRRLFEVPTVAGLAEAIEVARRADGQRQPPPLRRRPRSERPPLSFAQQRLWFLDRFEPGSPFYNIPAAARLTGELDVAALERSLREIIRRHETLRTTFQEVEGQPAQVIAADFDPELAVVDLSGLPEAEREAEARRRAREEAQRPFDLVRGPLLRALLLKLAAREHVVLLVLHHIVADGWSLGVFFRELAALYQGFAGGTPVSLPELPVQYADYAAWQRDWMRDEVLGRQLAYWKERLAGAPAALEMPTDRPRPPVQTVRGATEPLLIPIGLLAGIKALARREGCTPFMVLLAAFQALLGCYSGQDDVCVGTPIANRTRPELEGLIGFFVNTLVLRADLGGDPPFRQLLARVREAALGAYAHQDLPFEMLVEAMQPQRDLSRTPLFQVMFILQNTPLPSVDVPGLRFSPVEADSGTAKFDLLLALAETEQGLAGNLEYNSDLFEAATARRVLDHFRYLLEAAVADPARPLSELPLLTAAERRQVLGEWNATETGFPEAQTVHRLFEFQAEQTPEAVALVFEGEHLTYRELNARANRLAHSLQDLGVGPEVLVGICLERSVDMVVALLGVLKAGGAYVPLDPAYPQERLAFMIADAGVPVVLTQQALAAGLSGQGAWVLCVDTDAEAIAQQSEDNPFPLAGSDHLAYVIYTSGSTGRPKGVEITHGSVVNFLISMRRRPGLSERDILLAVTTLSFDIAALELFLPLSVGARVELARREVAQDGARLAENLAVSGATAMQATPATWRLLLESGWSGNPGLKILCGGEPLTPELAQQLLARGASVWNLYGPTETTIWSTVHQVDGRDGPVPIGRPIANTQVYVVDNRGQPVPVGVKGELLIGGAGVARGYRGRRELTAEKFIPDPFRGRPGARLYRTGDLARWLPGGELECLGRVDHQVKVRGFRIEPGEIEIALRQHPSVLHAAVAAREEDSGDKRLVAYVVPNPQERGEEATAGEEHVAHWQGVWDEAYARTPAQQDADFNLNGWVSSYTGLPLGDGEMREWVDHTVEHILALRPTRILEVGCGTGLLLFRLAPHCAHYTATDVSEQAVDYLRRQLPGCGLPVTLLQRPADDFSGFGEAEFDAVVLNSVVQYFPDIDYLLRVLERAVKATRPGGFVFVGDVRNLALLEAFHASVQLGRAPAALSAHQLLQRVRKKAAQEREMVIDPAFFRALQGHLPQVHHADVHLKRGRCHNEMAAFRYDVTLHIGQEEPPVLCFPWLDYRERGLTPSAVRRLLEEDAPEMLALCGVPNARIPAEVKALLREADPRRRTVGELRKDPGQEAGVDPEEFWALCESLPYAVDIRWTAGANDGRFDVVFQRRDRAGTTGAAVTFPGEAAGRRPWQTYANDPLRGKVLQDLVPRLRDHLKANLPEYMVPSAFVVLPALPLTPNGKLDRNALPAPEQQRPDWHGAFVAPRNPTEELLAALWAEILGLERVGVYDNFFDLGGHSLQAAQVVGRASKALHRDIPVKALFLHPTVAALAAAAEDAAAESPAPPRRDGGPSAAVPLAKTQLAALAPFMTIERRPLLPLFESGELAPVEAAAIGYLPSVLLRYTGLAPKEVIDGWCSGRPVVSGLYETPLGRIALLLIPRFDSQLYQEPEDLLGVLSQALRTAGKLGARAVSLTGLLPSATDYGLALQQGITGQELPQITTGHATTAAAVVLAVRRLLSEAGRDLTQERVGFVGLGSVGTASLRALLHCLPPPAEIRLCDVYGKREALLGLRRELLGELGYRGPVHVLEARGSVPPGLYESSLLIGATNVPDILDVDRLAPGTLLVDDSSPHCFPLDRAARRLRERRDILFTEGGMLRAPRRLQQVIYLPAELEHQ
jgi:amino acid adenylation domain-containing protein